MSRAFFVSFSLMAEKHISNNAETQKGLSWECDVKLIIKGKNSSWCHLSNRKLKLKYPAAFYAETWILGPHMNQFNGFPALWTWEWKLIKSNMSGINAEPPYWMNIVQQTLRKRIQTGFQVNQAMKVEDFILMGCWVQILLEVKTILNCTG